MWITRTKHDRPPLPALDDPRGSVLLDIECRVIEEESDMTAEAERMEGENDLVVIDTAGARNQAVLYAIGVADLVPIPAVLRK